MNVVFLDYDGVVNTRMWSADGKECRYAYPTDNLVNNFQAVQWVSEFCLKYGYSIVVTSSWRIEDNYAECLRNGGLRSDVAIDGKTPYLPDESRSVEINQYLKEHPEVSYYLIFDDEKIEGSLRSRLVECNPNTGFGSEEFELAERIHSKLVEQQGKWVSLRIDGYPRRCLKNKLPQVLENIEELKTYYLRKDVPLDLLDKMYTIEIIDDSETDGEILVIG